MRKYRERRSILSLATILLVVLGSEWVQGFDAPYGPWQDQDADEPIMIDYSVRDKDAPRQFFRPVLLPY
jgi:hypothetical protein